MSNTIFENNLLTATAFVGGDEYGKGIQLTIEDTHILLSGDEAFDLAIAILKRVQGKPGFRATD